MTLLFSIPPPFPPLVQGQTELSLLTFWCVCNHVVTRLVIGLAYPPPAPVQSETIPAGNPTPLTLIHDDLHGANILMGK